MILKCNYDCFNCPYPDVPEECLERSLTYNEYRQLAEIDSEILFPKTEAQRKVAAQRKAYREANKEKVAAQQKAWYEANKEKVAAQQECISRVRKSHRMTQYTLASLIGVGQATVSMWETGSLPANWDKLCAVMPELEKHKP